MQESTFTPTPTWYEDAERYWESVPATVDGVLGGLAVVDKPDITGSMKFLSPFVATQQSKRQPSSSVPQINTGVVCDCGAGIGRITKGLLSRVFDTVDLVEQDGHFLEQAKTSYLVDEIKAGKIGQFYHQGLQTFTPEPKRYDAIWCQWVLGHLTDDDFVDFFRRCQEGLTESGMIFVKENVTYASTLVDDEDSSVTREENELVKLLNAAGLTVVKKSVERGLIQGLLPVH
ncbi:hypothetical protein IWQ62_004066, partial [Dispira parvispora]